MERLVAEGVVGFVVVEVVFCALKSGIDPLENGGL